MKLSEMNLTSLNVLLATMPPNCSKEAEVKAEIEKREASKRWMEANNKVINLFVKITSLVKDTKIKEYENL